MRICFVAPANNYHTKKWANWFTHRGHEVHIISFINEFIPDSTVHFIDAGVNPQGADISKLKYFLHAGAIQKTIEEIQPNIVNAHYATSYGTAVALSGIKPYVLSVWGSDIYDFPKKSVLHKIMLKYSLRKATYLFSTSQAMANEGAKYTRKHFEITPFGVDMDLFNPNKRTRLANDGRFVIGTIKGLSDKYGIKVILNAAAMLKDKLPLEIRIAGKGPQEAEYKQYAKDLGIEPIVVWLGFISQDRCAEEWANMDIAIVPSESESFGVAAVEAQACGTPVIVSDVPGLLESTKPGITSMVIKRADVHQLAQSIEVLAHNPKLRDSMSIECRKFACDKYPIDKCFEKVEHFFEKCESIQYEFNHRLRPSPS